MRKPLDTACLFVIFFSLLACVPSFFVPIGFLGEGDALDYRVPLLKWILRHGSYPDWRFTFVDDYPVLGELLMLPFFALKQSLARLPSVLGYAGACAFAAAIGTELLPPKHNDKRRGFFLFAFASVLGLQPLLVQADQVMVDNIAACFVLGSFWLLLRERLLACAALLALALATRYSAWSAPPGMLLALVLLHRGKPGLARKLAQLTLVASLGALPFLLRNFLLNTNPVYPLLNGALLGEPVTAFDGWGRGKGLVPLLLFPFDLLFTNSFTLALFDTKAAPQGHYVYKLTLLFHAQLFASALVLLRSGRERLLAAALNPKARATAVFTACLFAIWWAGSQQLRFLGPALAVLNAALLLPLYLRLPRGALLIFALLPLVAVTWVRQESWKLALGYAEPLRSSGYVQSAERCFSSASITSGQVVGFKDRDGLNAFFNYDFVFLPPHNLYAEPKGASMPRPDFVFSGLDFGSRSGYEPWPAQKPCLLKRLP